MPAVTRSGDTSQRTNAYDDDWSCENAATDTVTRSLMTRCDANGEPDNVVYTEDEIDDNDALVVRAKSDGDEQSVNLYLSETGRFDGRYEGIPPP